MTGTVTAIWRHPIKAHGREALNETTLSPGCTLPGDRVWAVAHTAARIQGDGWAGCANFTRAAGAPQLMAITARTLDDRIEFSHPARPDLRIDPDTDAAAFLDWVGPLMPDDRAAPDRIVRAPGRGMTDSDFASVSLCNMASHRAVEQRAGRQLSIHRWRGNIWFDGLPVWEEFDWIGRDVRIGTATLRVRERTERCAATHANPQTGVRDIDMLAVLQSWGHSDFSVLAEVVDGGTVRPGDPVQPL